jgi:hypothetical protein
MLKAIKGAKSKKAIKAIKAIKATHRVKGTRYEKNGWIYLSVEGTPYECGYANGSLLATEIKEIFQMLDFNFPNNYGYPRPLFSEIVGELFKPQIRSNYPALYAELEGIVDGANSSMTAKNALNINDIIMWNCYTSIDYMLDSFAEMINAHPLLRTKYGDMFSVSDGSSKKEHHGEGGSRRGGSNDRCTAFIAVGSYTKDGKIVCAHNSFDNFIDGQYFNVMLDIHPAKGNRILMQAAPGCIASNTDFYVTSSGLICTETTIGGFNKFVLKDPICCRIRQAMQFENTLDGVLRTLKKNNSGDYANSWLLGDTNTNTIMRIELGLAYVNAETKTDGYFIGYNAPEDPRIRNLECANTGYYDIRRHQGARRVRLTELMQEHKGKLDLALAEKIIADHYDVYLQKINPSSRTCCGHYELDDRAYMSQADRPKPYQPRGAVDGIICDTAMAKKMSLRARWGSSCGIGFDKTAFCKKHIQWNDQEPYLHDRPKQPWTDFSVLSSSSFTKNKNNKTRKNNKKNI